jgi:hypothetical protein
MWVYMEEVGERMDFPMTIKERAVHMLEDHLERVKRGEFDITHKVDTMEIDDHAHWYNGGWVTYRIELEYSREISPASNVDWLPPVKNESEEVSG